MIKKGDAVLVGIIFLVTAIGFAGCHFWQSAKTNQDLIAVICQDGKVIERIDLNKVEEPRTITLTGYYHNKIRVEKGRIRYKDSDCLNRICINTGWLTKYGDIAVCLPNQTVIDIEQGK